MQIKERPIIMTAESVKARIAAANKLLATTPYKPVIYDTAQGLRLYVNRMGSGFASVDIAARVNYGNMYFCGKTSPSKRLNLPWGGTQERMIASLVTWVGEPGFKWHEDYWSRMVKDNDHWLSADAVAEFVARAAELREVPA